MSTNQRPMFNVFRKVNFDDSIEKIEWRTYYPYTRSFRNNDIIEIVINQSTLFDATYDSQLLVSGKIIKTGDGDVSFVNNAPAFMFSSVKYVLGGGSKEMELVQDPGIVSTVRGYLGYTSEDSKHLAISGWNFPNSPKLNPDGTFTFLIPLRHFFNIFNDYRTVICGMQTFTFTRANNDANCFIVKEKTPTSNTTVKMDIQNVELKIKRIYPESAIKEKLLEGVAANNSIIMPYRQWDVQVKTLAAGAISDAEKRPILDYDVFKERTLFVIDCSRRDENERPSTVDVRLEIEAAQGFPENTRAYCIIIHDCIMEYLPLDNIVNNLKA
ncbi:hypothetical protein NQ315_014892 [Exocentrus adspersus]|uniref:Double jelly roll-like domain-containing protein n=1 Tax=Exocentrus adspersus TaxID=1586481 RepID=A0AAV8VL77_9CUCU|nr:hypothetical protein NQ315_014892 [Exocentrus adspersus]